MIRKIFRKLTTNKSKFDHALEKYNVPREYFNVNRKMISKGVLVGLFWGFIPMPMQMLAVVMSTPFVRFNIFIAISMVWLSNPITMPFMYYMEYLTGSFILGLEGIEGMELTIQWFSDNIKNIFLPLYVGTAFYSVFASTFFYALTNCLWIRSVKKEKETRAGRRKRSNGE